MKDLTIIIKTLDRYVCLKPLVKSILKKYGDIKILIGDDSLVSCKEKIKKDFKGKDNIIVYDLPYDCGLSYGRNFLVSKVKTKYFCLCDDDFVFDKKTNLEVPLQILKEKNLDILGGYIRNYKIEKSFKDKIIKIGQAIFHYELPTNYIGTIEKKNDELIVNYTVHEFPEYQESDLVLNFFIAKTEVVKKYPWDNDLKLHEHTAFFYNAKNNNLKVAFTNKLSVRHCPIQKKNYNQHRKRNYFHVFMEKNKINKVTSIYDDARGTVVTTLPKINNIFISFVIPFYNCGTKAKMLINSLKAQTYNNFEVLLVNNNSSDNSVEVVKKYIDNDKRFKIINEKKQGPNHARFTGYKHAKGEFIYFADIDDFLDDDTIYQMVKTVSSTNCDVVVGNYNELNSQLFLNRQMMGAKNTKENLKDNNEFFFYKPALWNKMFRRSLIKDNYFTYTSIGEDMVLTFNIMAEAKDIRYLDFYVYNYILADDGLSSLVKINHLLQMKDTAKNLIETFKKNNKYDKYKEEVDYVIITHMLYRAFRGMLLKDKNERAELRKTTMEFLDTIEVKDNKYYKKSFVYKRVKKVVYSKFWYNSHFMRWCVKLLFTNRIFNKILKKLDK